MTDEIKEARGDEKESNGAFVNSLRRNNKQIKDDRAATISEDAQMAYQRAIEDLIMDIKRMRRSRENMLDLSPENSFSLMLGKDFDGKKFVEADTRIAVDLRNAEIKLELMQKQFTYLFGIPAPEVR